MTSRYKKNKKHLKDPYAFDTTDDDSDDEDEELFRPQLDLSQKSTRTTSTTDSTNTIEPTAAASTSTAAAPVVCTTAVSPETIETQAKRKAQLYVASSTTFAEITHPSMLKWARIKKKGHPCFVHPHPERRISGTDLQKPSSNNNKNKTAHCLVVFLGRSSVDSDKIQFVSERQLEPYNNNDNNNNNNNDQVSSYPDEWNPKTMQEYIKYISNHAVFRKQNKENQDSRLELRTEYWVLHYLLQAVLERQKRKLQQQQQKNNQQNKQDHDEQENNNYDNEDTDDDNDDQNHPDTTTSSISPLSPKEPPTPVFQRQLSWTQNTTTTTTNGKENHHHESARQKLRPGDVIEYNLPVSVACKETIRIGTIVEVHTGRDNAETAIKLDSGMFLSKTHYAILRQRYLHGKLQDNPHPVRTAIGDYQLCRGVLPDNVVETLASKTKRIFQQAQHEIQALHNNQSKNNGNNASSITKDKNYNQYLTTTKNNHHDSQRENPEFTASSSSSSLRARKNPSVSGSTSQEKTVPQKPSEFKAYSPVRSKRVRSTTEHTIRPDEMIRAADEGVSKKTITKQASQQHQEQPEQQQQLVPQHLEEPRWKRHLDQQLERNAENRKKRRYDADKVDAMEEALKVAIQVRFRMDEIAVRDDTYVESIVDHLLEGIMKNYTTKRLWDYLIGDPHKIISLRERKEMTEEWKEWLDETASNAL